MTPPTRRQLIVNGDDFGRTEAVNAGITAAHEQGILTSASLMVRWPAAAGAARQARALPGLGVGLHVDLGEWEPRGGDWVAVYEVDDVDDARRVTAEVERQLAAFRELLGRDPTHLDSHQHVHLREPVLSILVEIAGELAVPLRHHDPRIRYCGEFYGQTGEGQPLPEGISVDGLIEILAALQPGVTELACHPGLDDELQSTYRSERVQEVRVLCDPRVRATVAASDIELCSFTSEALQHVDPAS